MAETLEPISLEEIKASVARGEASRWNVGPDGNPLSEGYTMNEVGEVVWVGEGPEPTEEVEKIVDTIPPLYKIFDHVSENEYYTDGDFEKFKEDFSSEEKQNLLYDILKKDGSVTEPKGDFLNYYFPIADDLESEVKGDPSQEGVTVDGKDTASNGADDSSVTPKVYSTKPKNAEEVQQSLFTLKDSIDGKNEIVTNRVVEKYFNEPLEGFDKWLKDNDKQTLLKVFNPRDKSYRYEGKPLTKPEKEKYLKEYLGEQKYNEYVAWDDGNGALPTDSEECENVLNKEITERQKKRKKERTRER